MDDSYYSHDYMRNCRVIKTVNKSTTFELFEQSDNGTEFFILSCVVRNDFKGEFLFTKCRYFHQKHVSELTEQQILGRMSSDWLTGLVYKLYIQMKLIAVLSFDQSILDQMPVSFRIRLYPYEFHNPEDSHEITEVVENQIENNSFFNLTSCLTNSCLDSSGQETNILINAIEKKLSYSQINKTNMIKNSIIHLHTKKPQWNRELNKWMHSFGGRVKTPANTNFLIIQNDNFYSLGRRSVVCDHVLDYDNMNKIIIRHGQCSSDSYILDFQEPVSALVALASLVSAQSSASSSKT